MNGGNTRAFRRFDDPAANEASRWLDREILGRGGGENREGIVATLIDSIDTRRRIRAWMAVERALGRGEDSGPRAGIMNRLEQREAELNRQGYRPDRLPHGPWPPCECCEPGETEALMDELRAERAKQREMIHYEPDGATGADDDDGAEASTLDAFAVATDGGDTNGK